MKASAGSGIISASTRTRSHGQQRRVSATTVPSRPSGRAGLAGEEARVLRNLTFLPDRSLDEKLQLIASAVDRARLAGARSVEGLALHAWSDLLFGRNDYAGAMTKLEAALPLLETWGSGRDLARLYTSFGRLYRIHGDPARALTYYERALERQRVLRDLTGEIQTINAIALALSVLGRDKEAAARYEDALSLCALDRSAHGDRIHAPAVRHLPRRPRAIRAGRGADRGGADARPAGHRSRPRDDVAGQGLQIARPAGRGRRGRRSGGRRVGRVG